MTRSNPVTRRPEHRRKSGLKDAKEETSLNKDHACGKREKEESKSARRLFLDIVDPEQRDLLSRLERTHLANAVDFVARRHAEEERNTDTSIGEVKRAGALLMESGSE
ncbi:hypothetical protein ALC60_04050 [Trachymyrmex zeteki]|uniref:Uncharacterized protein n=1 Tax=Mycetomoellerius zeteki TaxID=64791 RepID=A0A151X9L8_9HYME|nr:hypothetical protein ALC60_04050 [Trachymyrmex zeteki]